MKLLLAAVCLGAFALAPAGASAPASTPTSAAAATAAAPAPNDAVQNGSTPAPAVTTDSSGDEQRQGVAPDPHFHLVPVRDLPSLGAKLSNGPTFRGGSRSRLAGAPAPSSPRTGTPTVSLANPAVLGSLNKPGIAAADNTSLGNPGVSVPPDSTGAIGPNNYVEFANSVAHVWDRNLNSVSSATFSTFLGVTDPWCDPQVQWDAAANRYLYVLLFCAPITTGQGFVLGWSRTADPSNLSPSGWCAFGVGTGSLVFDYPKLGHNANYLIVGGNFFDFGVSTTNPPFTTSAMAWLPLPANGDSSCTTPSGLGNTPINTTLREGDGATNAYTPVPVNTDSAASNVYVLSAYDPSGGNGSNVTSTQSKIGVWHLDSAGALHQDSDVSVAPYTVPSNALQPSPARQLDTLDGRLTQAVGDPVSGIWTQHTVNPPAGATPQVDWYELAVSGSALGLVQQGVVAQTGVSIFNAAISPNLIAHGAAIEYSKSSTSANPSIAVQLRVTSTPLGAMEPGETVIATSAAADSETLSCNAPPGAPCRWGDYSALNPDPVNPYVVWGSNEIITSNSSTPAWRDQNFAIVAATPPAAPTGVTATSGEDGFSCVSWTTPASDPPPTGYTITAYQGATAVGTVAVPASPNRGCVNGLTDGTAYTFTVTATSVAGTGPESAHSAPATPARGAAASGSGTASSRSGVTQSPTRPVPPPR